MFVRSLRVMLFVLSAFAVVGFTIIAAGTVARPQPLDPVEVTALERAARFAGGGTLCVEPVRPDEPVILPGFPFAVSGFVLLFGPDLRQPRLLTVLATFLIAALLAFVIRLETESWTLAVAGAGCLLLGYGLLAEPPGVARPETVVLLLALLGFLALRLVEGIRGALLASVPLAAAYFTGAQGFFFVAAALVAIALDQRARMVSLSLALAVLVGGGHALLSEALGPWFNFEAWDAPLRSLRPDPLAPLHFVGDHLLGRTGVLTLAIVLSFAMPTPPWRGKGGLWMCFGLAAILASLAATQSAYYGPGSLISAVVATALLGPISMQRVTRHLAAWPGSTRLGGQGVVLTALALQFVVFLSCAASSSWLGARPPAERRPAAVVSATTSARGPASAPDGHSGPAGIATAAVATSVRVP